MKMQFLAFGIHILMQMADWLLDFSEGRRQIAPTRLVKSTVLVWVPLDRVFFHVGKEGCLLQLRQPPEHFPHKFRVIRGHVMRFGRI